MCLQIHHDTRTCSPSRRTSSRSTSLTARLSKLFLLFSFDILSLKVYSFLFSLIGLLVQETVSSFLLFRYPPPRLAKGKTGTVERPEDDPLAIEAALPAPDNPAGLSPTLLEKYWPLDHSFRGRGWRWRSKEASLTGSAIRGSRSRRYFRWRT